MRKEGEAKTTMTLCHLSPFFQGSGPQHRIFFSLKQKQQQKKSASERLPASDHDELYWF